MLPTDLLLPYLAAVIIVVLAPGPDNILAVGRGLSQGALAAALSSLGAGIGIMFHTVGATVGLALILQTSNWAFWVVKAIGATYLIWLGYKAVSSRGLISFVTQDHQPLLRVFATGLLSNVLNPKPGLFVLAFLPQFVDVSLGSVPNQILLLGGIFAVVTVLVFSALGAFASRLAGWLQRRPKAVAGLNIGAGLTFIAAGLSILTLQRKT